MYAGKNKCKNFVKIKLIGNNLKKWKEGKQNSLEACFTSKINSRGFVYNNKNEKKT